MKDITTIAKEKLRPSRYKPAFRVFAALLITSFAIEEMAYASGGQVSDWNYALSALKPHKEEGLAQFSADQAWVVKEKIGQDDLSVIHIQDAHQKIGAQLRIAELLERLVAGYELRLASVEGAAGEVDPGIVSAFPRPGARRVLAESMLRLGRVSAAEFQAMVSEKPLKLYGAEEEELYDANIEVFKRVVDLRPQINRELSIFRNALAAVRDRGLSPSVLEFLRGRISRGDATTAVSERWAECRKFAEQAGIDPHTHPSLKLFSEALDLEKRIDFGAAGIQREALMEELAKRLDREDLRELVLKAAAYRGMRTAPADFHAAVARRAQAAGIPASDYPDFLRYARYLAIFDSMDIQSVFVEVTRLEDEILRKLARTPEERMVLDVLDRAETLARILKTSATSAEHARFLAQADYALPVVRRDFERACAQYGVQIKPGPEAWDLFGRALADNLEFYDKADQRSRALIAKTVERMKKEKVRVAALVAGGFHSDGLSKLMDQRKLSYLVVMPKFDESQGDRPYVTVLTQRPQEYEEAFKDSGFFLADPAFFTPKNFGPSGMSALVAALLVADRISGQEPTGAGIESGVDQALLRTYEARAAETSGQERSRLLSEILARTDRPRRVAEGLYEVTAGGRRFEVPVDSVKKILTAWPREARNGPSGSAGSIARSVREADASDTAFFINQWNARVSVQPVTRPKTEMDSEILRYERIKSVRFTPAQKASFAEVAARILPAGIPAVSGTGVGRQDSESPRIRAIQKTPAAADEPASKARVASNADRGHLVRRVVRRLDRAGLALRAAGARLCGICGVVLQQMDSIMRNSPDKIYPAKIRETLAYYMLNLTRRGHHGAGVALMLKHRKTGYRTFRLVKMPNSAGHNPFTYRREGGPELTRRLTRQFAQQIDALQKEYDVVDMKLAGHVRLATSAGEQSVRNTQCFHIGRGPEGQTRLVDKVRVQEGTLQVTRETDELLFAANGDLVRAALFADGRFYDQEKIRDFFIRLYGVPSGTNDSETAAYLLYFLTTQGIWEKSITKSFVTTMMSGIDAALPTPAEIKRWTMVFKETFEARAPRLYAPDSRSLADVRDIEAKVETVDQIITRLRGDESFRGRSEGELRRFAADAVDAFTDNDPFMANRQSMKRVSNDSSYGSQSFFTGYPEEYILLSRQQPVALAHNFTQNRTVYGSSSVLAKETMRRFLTDESDEVKVLRLIPRVRHDGQGGECVRIHNTEGIELYSMTEDRVIDSTELLDGRGASEQERLQTKRWASQTNNPYNVPLVPAEVEGVSDPVEADIKVIPLVARRSLERWADANSFSRRTFEDFAEDFERLAVLKEKLLRGGSSRSADGALDLVLVSFRENMEAMKHFENLLLSAFDPKIFKIRVIQGNDFIKNVNKVPMDEHTIVLFDDPSGSTFPINRGVEYAVEASQRARSGNQAGSGRPYQPDDERETPATWDLLMDRVEARSGNVYVLANQVEGDAQAATGQQYGPDSPFGRRIFTTDFAPAIDGSAAEIAAHVIEAEHIFFGLMERLRQRFPRGAPLGLTLTGPNLRDLRTEFEHKLSRRLPRITGMDFDSRNRPKALLNSEAPEHAELLRYSGELVPYFLEGAKALVASVSHLWLSVILGVSTLSLGAWILSLFGLALNSSFIPVAVFMSPIAVLAMLPFLVIEAARYQWFPYAFTLYLRWREGRELFDRTGPRTVVFTDSDWHLTERIGFDDGFGLSRGWTGVNTKNASQTKDLDDEAPNVRRGTIIAMSVPAEMNEATEVDRVVAGSIKSSKIVGAIQSYLRKGPLVVGIGAHKEMDDLGFRHFASIHDKAADRRRSSYRFGGPKNERDAKIILHYSDTVELLVAQSVCYRWKIPASVASYQVPFLGNLFGYSILGSQNSSIATTQSPLAGIAIRETTAEEWLQIRDQLERESRPETAPAVFPSGGVFFGEARFEYEFIGAGAIRIGYDLDMGAGPVTADFYPPSNGRTGEAVYKSAAGDKALLVRRGEEVFLKIAMSGQKPVYFHAEDTGDLVPRIAQGTGFAVGARLAVLGPRIGGWVFRTAFLALTLLSGFGIYDVARTADLGLSGVAGMPNPNPLKAAASDLGPGQPQLWLSREAFERSVVPAVKAGHGKGLDRLVADPDRRIRASTASEMAFSGNPDYVPALVGLLSDDDPRVRSVAAFGLGRLGTRAGEGTSDLRRTALLSVIARHSGASDIITRARAIEAMASMNDLTKTVHLLDLILNRTQAGDRSASAIWRDAGEKKSIEEIHHNLTARPEHSLVRHAALRVLSSAGREDFGAFQATLRYCDSLLNDAGPWFRPSLYDDLGPEANHAFAALRDLVRAQKKDLRIASLLKEELNHAYSRNHSAYYLSVLMPLLEEVDAAAYQNHLEQESWRIRVMSLHRFYARTRLLWPALIVLLAVMKLGVHLTAPAKKSNPDKMVKKSGVRFEIPDEPFEEADEEPAVVQEAPLGDSKVVRSGVRFQIPDEPLEEEASAPAPAADVAAKPDAGRMTQVVSVTQKWLRSPYPDPQALLAAFNAQARKQLGELEAAHDANPSRSGLIRIAQIEDGIKRKRAKITAQGHPSFASEYDANYASLLTGEISAESTRKFIERSRTLLNQPMTDIDGYDSRTKPIRRRIGQLLSSAQTTESSRLKLNALAEQIRLHRKLVARIGAFERKAFAGEGYFERSGEALLDELKERWGEIHAGKPQVIQRKIDALKSLIAAKRKVIYRAQREWDYEREFIPTVQALESIGPEDKLGPAVAKAQKDPAIRRILKQMAQRSDVQAPKRALERVVRRKIASAGSAAGARLAVGVWVPQSADRAAFEASFDAKFAEFIGRNAGRFRLVYEAAGSEGSEAAIRSMKARGVSVVIDSSSLRDQEAASRLLRLLAEFDDQTFSALYPFVARLTDASFVETLSRSELAAVFRFLAIVFPRPSPRVIRAGRLGAFVDPEVSGGATSAEAEAAARELDGVFHRMLVSPEEGSDGLFRAREVLAGYLAAHFDRRGPDGLKPDADLLARTMRQQPRTRLALYDPSYRENIASMPRNTPDSPKTIVTDLDVFVKDGGGLPYALRIERLNRRLPGMFEHALLVRDPSIRNPEELRRRHPETTVFGNRVLFRPGLSDLSGLNDADRLREEFIVLTSEPGVLSALGKPSGAKTAIVLSLSADSATTVRFLETGARFLADPTAVPGLVRPGSGGVWLFLPVAVPVDYLIEIQRLSRRATESAA